MDYYEQEIQEVPLLLQVTTEVSLSPYHAHTIPQDVPSSEVLWYHVIFVAVMFLLIGLDLVVTRLCQ